MPLEVSINEIYCYIILVSETEAATAKIYVRSPTNSTPGSSIAIIIGLVLIGVFALIAIGAAFGVRYFRKKKAAELNEIN